MAKKVVVKRGQNLRDVAAAEGLPYGGLRDANPSIDPNCLVPGAELSRPDKKTDKTTQAQSGSAKKATADRTPSVIRLKLKTADGKALARARGTLDFGGKRKAVEVTTDSSGQLEAIVPALPDGVRVAKLEIAGRRLVLRLACLAPCADAKGNVLWGAMRGRLANLGYAVKEGDHPPDPAVHVALATFQADAGVSPIDGEATKATLERLAEVHGC